MFTAPKREAFLAHQARILAQLGAAEDLIRVGDDGSISALDRARQTLKSFFHEYRVFKHQRLFDPAIGSGTPARVAAAREMKASCIAGGALFDAYAKRWNGGAVKEAWPEYRAAATAMIAVLRGHLEQEQRSLERIIG